MNRPTSNEFPEYYTNYISLASGNNISDLIAQHNIKINNFYENLPEEKADFSYADGKWTIKDVLQHLIDAERVFTYRATRFARNDSQALLGFEENDYAKYANATSRTLQSIKDEFLALRKATNVFLASLNDEQLQQTGFANNQAISVNAIAFIIFGHLLHHKNIIEERYLL